MMKQERTCKCINGFVKTNDNDNTKECNFIERHEYQVDVYVYLERSHYKVYSNGGWNDFVFLEQSEFDEHFELIE